MGDDGRKAFRSGANAAITGDFLTTSGNKIDDDKAMLSEMGFSIWQDFCERKNCEK